MFQTVQNNIREWLDQLCYVNVMLHNNMNIKFACFGWCTLVSVLDGRIHESLVSFRQYTVTQANLILNCLLYCMTNYNSYNSTID